MQASKNCARHILKPCCSQTYFYDEQSRSPSSDSADAALCSFQTNITMAENARFNRTLTEIRDTVLATQRRVDRLATRSYVEESREETNRSFGRVQDSIELSAEGFEELTQACTAVGGRLNTLEQRLGPQGQLLRAIDEKTDRFRQSLNTATEQFNALNRHVDATMQGFQGRFEEHSRTVERQLDLLRAQSTGIENRLNELEMGQTRLGNQLRVIEGSLGERLNERLEDLHQRLDGRLNLLEHRFDQRFDGFNQRFDGLDHFLNNFERHLGEQHRQVSAELTLHSENARRSSQTFEALQREIRAGHYNNAARVLNTTVIKVDARLYEFRGIDNRPILDFPTNPAALKRLSSDRLNELLERLGLDTDGDVAQRRRLLVMYLGIAFQHIYFWRWYTK